ALVDDAAGPADHPSGRMQGFTRLRGSWAQALDDPGVAPGRHEADVLAVGLLGGHQAERAGEPPGFRLVEVAERKAQHVELPRRGGKQEIALVAIRVLRPIELEATRAWTAPHVVAGGEHGGAELLSGFQQVAKLDLLVAGNARHRRFASEI